MIKKTIVLTGTHFTPAEAIIEKLTFLSWQVVYLGRSTSFSASNQPAIERQLLSSKRVKFHPITTAKLDRHRPLRSFLILFTLPLGLFQSLYHLISIKPSVVVSFGGYVSLPVGLAAKLLSIPLILHEQTLAAGVANKLLTLFANKIAISWPQSQSHFPAKKTVLTGNPIRSDLLKAAKKSYQSSQHQPKTIYLTGGNQGSKIINQTITSILPKLLKEFQVIHQFGLAQSQADFTNQQSLRKNLNFSLKQNYTLKRWFTAKELALILVKADLVISRSGINTITELALFNCPAILIPLPYTQKNEQLKNAKFLTQIGQAKIITQSQLTPAKLLKAIQKMPPKILKPTKFQLNLSGTKNLYQLIVKISSA